MKSAVAFIVAVLTGLVVLVAGTVAWSVGRVAVTASAAAAHPTLARTHLYLTIATPDMLGTQLGPAFLPSTIVVPANAEVTVTVANFDGNTPLTGSATKYATATGLAGPLTCRQMDPANPNAASRAPASSSTSVDPAQVSHTFTVGALGLNVPICGSCQTTFTFFSGGAGHYTWRCMDPCGTGPSGWGGAMALDGYMTGEITVV